MCFIVLHILYFNLNINMTEIERDDLLLDQLLQSKRSSLDQQKASRQNCILVASLLDRIPNLAGLARSCEVSFSFCSPSQSLYILLSSFLHSNCCLKQVFGASGLAIADKNIISDKQFQLIRFG